MMRDAVIQFEYDKKRIEAMGQRSFGNENVSTPTVCKAVALGALHDVFRNGGTLVIVVDDEKVTVVQRTTAERFTPPEPAPDV